MTGVITYKTHEFLEKFKESSKVYKFYSDFNIKIDDSYDSYKKCNITTGTSNGKKCPTVKEITQKWKDEFNKITADGNNIAERCYYLILWVYDRIKGCDKNNYCISWYYGLLEKFWDESKCCDKDKSSGKEKVEGDSKGKDSDECNQPCKDKFIKTFNLDVLKKKRELYDFLEYYDHIKDISPQIYKQNNEEYCKYIRYILNLYRNLEEEYKERELPHIYEEELSLFRNKFSKDNELSSIKSKCNINDSIIESKRTFDTTRSFAGNQKNGVPRHTILPEYGSYNPRTSTDIKAVLSELSSKIYKELENAVGDNDYKSTHCDSLGNQIKTICEKTARNLKVLSTNNETKKESYRDRCTYLNFWIYEEISKLDKNEDKNLTDITDVAKLIDANIKINMDLIKDDFKTNNYKLKEQTTITDKTAKSTNTTSSQGPAKFVKHYELSKHEPCYFNYDCTLSECREMKHLFEYFKNYDEINEKIDCGNRQKDKYYKYLKYMSYLYNKHKYDEECCSWGATVCSDYFLECDEYYDPRKLISAIESNDQTKCEKIKNSLIANKSEEISTIDPKDKNNMYIKYLTCSRATHSNFENEGLKCQQPEFNALRNNKFTAVRPVYKAQKSNSKLRGKQLTINGKSINVVLISDPNSIITGEENSKIPELENYNTLFPEIRGAARENYVKQAEEACKNGKPTEGMETYCKRSKRYNDIINRVNLQSRKHVEVGDTQYWENIDSPADTSFLNDLLQQLPVRIGAVSLASLGTITMLFMYYKFTPLGSWLRNAMRGEKKMKHGNHRETLKSLNYQQDDMPQFSQKKRIKIAYQNS